MRRVGVELMLHRAAGGVWVLLGVGLVVACGALRTATSLTPGDGGNVGYLEGQVTIGPLRPVERVGVPPPTPPPELCTSLSLIVARADGGNEVTRFGPQPDCSYRVTLEPGSYVVRFAAGSLRRARNLPATVQIVGGKTTRLDVNIDTGIR